MPTINKSKLISELQNNVLATLEIVKALPTDNNLLNKQPGFKKWSGAQVLEHLNFYNRAYLPNLEKRMIASDDKTKEFRSGWLGNYFTGVMQPGIEGQIANKMSAPKDARPVEVLDAKKVISDFIKGQETLLKLLEKAKISDLNTRIPTSISKLIRLKAGDTFRFLVAHQQRHMVQLKHAVSDVTANFSQTSGNS